MSTKSWGPFNGRQLTTMFVALTLGAVMIPTAAWAVGLTKVVVTDPGGLNKAHVDATGSLQSAAAAPASFYRKSTFLGTTFQPIATPPAGTALIVKTVHVNTFDDPTPGPNGTATLDVMDTTCTTFIAFVDLVNPAVIGLTALPYEPGLAVPAGKALCAEEQGSVRADVTAYGYTVPASTVPAAVANPGPAPVLPQQHR